MVASPNDIDQVVCEAKKKERTRGNKRGASDSVTPSWMLQMVRHVASESLTRGIRHRPFNPHARRHSTRRITPGAVGSLREPEKRPCGIPRYCPPRRRLHRGSRYDAPARRQDGNAARWNTSRHRELQERRFRSAEAGRRYALVERGDVSQASQPGADDADGGGRQPRAASPARRRNGLGCGPLLGRRS